MNDKPYANPAHAGNSAQHLSGKPCIEPGCNNPAGTAWSPHWCQPCNAARMDRIGDFLSAAVERFAPKEQQ